MIFPLGPCPAHGRRPSPFGPARLPRWIP